MSDLTLVSRYLKPYRRQFVLAALCAFAEATLELCIPFVMASIVDVGVATGDMGLVLALGARMVALAAVAGALGVRLNGPGVYGGVLVQKPYVGDATRQIEPGDVARTCRLMYAASMLALAAAAVIRLAICLAAR